MLTTRVRRTMLVVAAASGVLLHGALTLAGAPRAGRGAQAGQAVASLSTVGAVTVNGAMAPADSTIFAGDTLKTNESGSAAFSISGKGSFKIAPNSEMTFPPDPRYSGELKAGTVVMNSFGGATDISVRVGNFVVAPVIQAQQSASKVERRADGSFVITCLEGSVGLIPLEGTTGRVLQPGESVTILASGELDVAQASGTPAAGTEQASAGQPPPVIPSEPPAVQHKDKKNQYVLLGLAGGAAVAIAVGIAAAGHGSSSVSPSAP